MLKKFTNQRDFTFMTFQYKRQVGAGKVVPFVAKKHTQTIAIPSKFERLEPDPFAVCGDSFIEEDIHDGDLLVIICKFERSEVTEGRLCVVRVGDADEMLKRVYTTSRNRIRLACGNRRYKDLYYNPDMVEIVGLVVGKWQDLK